MDVRIAAELACVLEATARKPGNVHRDRERPDLSFLSLMASAAAIGPPLAAACRAGVGRTIYDAVAATRSVAATNTNLGIVLLLAPLAAAAGTARADPLAAVGAVLERLTVEDADWTYRAIRMANPGGLGESAEQDVANSPSVDLRSAMALAAERDSIARQYLNGFVDVSTVGVSTFAADIRAGRCVEAAIILTHLRFGSILPDSLIARKFGAKAALETARRFADLIAIAGSLDDRRLLEGGELAALDDWLAQRGYNPGTTADLTAATIFCCLLCGKIAMHTPFIPPRR